MAAAEQKATGECTICLIREATIIAVMCGHLICCVSCRRRLVHDAQVGAGTSRDTARSRRGLSTKQLERTKIPCPVCRTVSVLGQREKFLGQVFVPATHLQDSETWTLSELGAQCSAAAVLVESEMASSPAKPGKEDVKNDSPGAQCSAAAVLVEGEMASYDSPCEKDNDDVHASPGSSETIENGSHDDEVQITVCSALSGNQKEYLKFCFSPEVTVLEVKRCISAQRNLPIAVQKLVVDGGVAEVVNGTTLSDLAHPIVFTLVIVALDKKAGPRLLVAARSGDMVRLVEALAARANPDFVSAVGETALVSACTRDHLAVVRCLCEHGANPDLFPPSTKFPALTLSIMLGKFAIVKVLIEAKAAFEPRTVEPTGWFKGFAPVHLAANKGHVEILRYLVECRADYNRHAKHGGTALYVAAVQNHVDIIEYLGSLGADTSLRDSQNATPLYIAVQQGSTEALRALLVIRADVDNMPPPECSPLNIASQKGFLECAKLLVGERADVDKISGEHLATPLLMAGLNGHLSLIRFFLECKADQHKMACDGSTPLLAATKGGFADAVTILAQAKSDVNKTLGSGFAPLHLAIKYDRVDVVKALLRLSCDMNKTMGSVSPVVLARAAGHREIVWLLMQAGTFMDCPHLL